jgi:hypothetical protein
MGASYWPGLLATVSVILLSLILLLRISGVYRPKNAAARRKLLNEIERWAMDVISCGFSESLDAAGSVTDPDQLRSFTIEQLEHMRRRYMAMRGRGRRVANLARAFDQDLQAAVSQLVNDLVDHTSLLNECLNAVPGGEALPALKTSFHALLAQAMGNEEKLAESAHAIEEIASRVRIADAG